MAVHTGLVPFWTRLLAPGLLLLALVSRTNGLAISYCSSENTAGDFQSVYDMYMSNGKCQTVCQSSYVYAVIQGQYCWCSNYIPADQVSTYSCSQVCPGFGSEWCGNTDAGLYGYFQLNNRAPSGTAGGSSSSSSPSPSPSPSPTPTSSSLSSTSSPSTTSSSSTTPQLTEVSTVIISQGQTKTVLVTATPTTDSTLGNSAPISSSNNSGGGGGVSAGKVAGAVIGAALGIGLLIGLAVWLWLRRRHRRNMEAASLDSSSARGSNGAIPSRQVSQMSSAGLLGKAPRIITSGLSSGNNPRSADPNFDRRSLGTDQRLNPYAIYAHDESRHSNVSLQDNQDYSRQLRVANPDP